MLIQSFLIGDYSNEGLNSFLPLMVVGIPYAYGFGAAAAIPCGLAYWALRRRYEFRVAIVVVTAAGTLIGPLGAVMLWVTTPAESDDVFARLSDYLLSGGCAACMSAFLCDSSFLRSRPAPGAA
jgi:hypothetical protein